MQTALHVEYEKVPVPTRGLANRVTGAYLGLAVGDALGASVEFMTAREIQFEYGLHDTIRGGGWLNLKSGQVTDDTTMALALGRSILQQGRVEAQAVAEAFSEWLKRKPVDVGNTVRRGIVHYRRSGEPETPLSEYDAGNGACMRCLPVALATHGQSTNKVREAAQKQAHVTHNNVLSDAATLCVIETIQNSLWGRNKIQLRRGPVDALLDTFPQFLFDDKHRDNPSGYIVETLQAVFQAFFSTESFEDCLVNVVNRGGDADTTGAIAGMIAGSYYGCSAIPYKWRDALDDEVHNACEAQALELLSLSAQHIDGPE